MALSSCKVWGEGEGSRQCADIFLANPEYAGWDLGQGTLKATLGVDARVSHVSHVTVCVVVLIDKYWAMIYDEGRTPYPTSSRLPRVISREHSQKKHPTPSNVTEFARYCPHYGLNHVDLVNFHQVDTLSLPYLLIGTTCYQTSLKLFTWLSIIYGLQVNF